MTDDLNREPEQNPEDMDFADAGANLEDDPAVQEVMIRGFQEPPPSSTREQFAQLEAQAAEMLSTENNVQLSIADEKKKNRRLDLGNIERVVDG
ncbi:MAG: hypothetical protein ABI690_33910 [Chloroflexota bacterium]